MVTYTHTPIHPQLLAKLNANFELGKYYEAQNLVITFYGRYRAKGEKKHRQGVLVLENGAKRLLQKEQVCTRVVPFINAARNYIR